MTFFHDRVAARASSAAQMDDAPPPWDGSPVAPPPTSAWSSAHLVPPGPPRPPLHRRRWVQVSVAALLGLVIGTLGTEAGGASEGRERELLAAQDAAETLRIERDDALAQVGEVEKQLAEAKSSSSEATEQAAALSARAAELDAQAKELAAAAAELAEREAAVSAQADAVVQEDEAAPQGIAGGGSETSSDAYYPNCSAARAAGAAPVRAGDPGYGTHLDRDGDGVGCE